MGEALREVRSNCKEDPIYKGAWDWYREETDSKAEETTAEEFLDALVGCYEDGDIENAVNDVLEQDHDLSLDTWPVSLLDVDVIWKDIQEDYNVGYMDDMTGFWVFRQ